MKKFVLVLVIALMLAQTAFAASTKVEFADFNSSTKVLSINATYPSQTKLTVSVVPLGYEYSDSSSSNPPKFIYFYDTAANGALDIDITLSSALSSGEYEVIIDSPTDSIYDTIIYANPSDHATVDVISRLNAAQSGEQMYTILTSGTPADNASKLGLDSSDSDFVTYASIACNYCYAYKTGSYTFDTFLSAYYNGITAYKLTQSVKATTIYGDLRTLVENNAALFGINLSSTDYQNVTEKYKVYQQIFTNRSSLTDAVSVKNAFNSAVTSVLAAQVAGVVAPQPTYTGGGGGSITIPNTDPDVENIYVNPVSPDAYSDIAGHFSESSVKALSDKGVISGYPDGTFRPNDGVTRAELAKMAAVAYGIESAYNDAFTDVTESDWFAGYVGALSLKDILKGYDGKFNPYEAITRQDVACVIYRLLTMANIQLTPSATDFEDNADISDYALEAVKALHGASIVNGSNNKFYPASNITRGEVAVMISNALSAYENQ